MCTYFQQGMYFTYNFFNFEAQTVPDISLFDIQKCYTDKQQHRFQLKFPGKMIIIMSDHTELTGDITL